MTEISNALRYLKEECPSLLSGDLPERVRALKSWVELHQGQSRSAIYERIAMAIALKLAFGANRGFMIAVSLKPVRHGETLEPVRVFVEAVNLCGAAPDRSQRQRISRDVRATRYLLSGGISPDKVCSLAQLSGEGVHTWAKRSVKERKVGRVSRRSNLADGVEAPAKRRKVEITMRTGRGKMRSHQLMLEDKDIHNLQEMMKLMELKSPKPRVRKRRSKSFVPRSQRPQIEGAFDDPELKKVLNLIGKKIRKAEE